MLLTHTHTHAYTHSLSFRPDDWSYPYGDSGSTPSPAVSTCTHISLVVETLFSHFMCTIYMYFDPFSLPPQSYTNPATPGGASYDNPATPSPVGMPESPQGSSYSAGQYNARTPMYNSDYMTPSPAISPLTPGSMDYSPRTPGSPMEGGELEPSMK